MRHIYPDFAYSDAPRAGCWWDETCAMPERPTLDREHRCDVVIVGGGSTGVSAALHLAEAGIAATVLENRYVGWGASGRNGGFCCLGGRMLDNAALDKQVGRAGRDAWRQTEHAAVNLVDDLTTRFNIDVDRHSDGETQFAHRPKDMEAMRGQLGYYAESYGVEARLTEKTDLESEGMNAALLHGSQTSRNAPSPRQISCGTLEAGASKCSHPV